MTRGRGQKSQKNYDVFYEQPQFSSENSIKHSIHPEDKETRQVDFKTANVLLDILK